MTQAVVGGATEVSAYCPLFQEAVELIGRRWTGAIVRSMLAGSHRFSDILRKVPGLSDRLLSERLRELEAVGVVTRSVFPETPVRVEYSLTRKGEELRGIVIALGEWAEAWAPGNGRSQLPPAGRPGSRS